MDARKKLYQTTCETDQTPKEDVLPRQVELFGLGGVSNADHCDHTSHHQCRRRKQSV